VLVATLHRIAAAVLVLIAVSAIIFFTGNALAPGSAVTTLVGNEGATAAQTRALEHRLGLDESLPQQYWRWLTRAARGNFGTSPLSSRSATDVIRQEAPVTLEIAFLALVLGTLIGVPLGVIAAARPGGIVDVSVRGLALVGFSVPVFVTGTLLVIVTARYIPSLYSPQYVPLTTNVTANLRSMALPVIAAALPSIATLVQLTRGTLLECLSQPYIAFARARGLASRRIYFVHALKSSLPPILTFQGFHFGLLVGTLVVVEQVFSMPGLGRGIISDIGRRDFVLVEAEALVIAVCFILGNLLVEVLEPVVDPQKRKR
jgi:peptide/nickel transport system permease protein